MPSRESELYKDKIEVSLDGRQIFYLFFGGAVIVGLVFVLGVMVGRRVEARGHLDRAQTQAASDPLAALDRLERSDNLSFHGALTGAEAPTDVEKAIGELEKKRTGEAKPAEAKAEKTEAKAEKVEAKAEKAEAKAEKVETKAEKAEAKAEKTEAKHDGDKHDGDKHKKHDDAEAKHDGDKHDGDKKSGKFTLQLSSFQDKSEAEAFLSATRSAGYQATVTEAEVNGKTFYRVRLGSYRSADAAADAKAEYEKSAKKSAQVMRM
ncbi:MAG TPA: SPOR domain-containing protein [Kofleriaceae bacterium]|nr:SPOR domain-containing protein [Kofleriaceae bacterium]